MSALEFVRSRHASFLDRDRSYLDNLPVQSQKRTRQKYRLNIHLREYIPLHRSRQQRNRLSDKCRGIFLVGEVEAANPDLQSHHVLLFAVSE